MIFDTKRKVENNVFEVQVVFTDYGTDDMDAEHEKALFNDLGYPEINLGNITFSGKFKVDADTRVISAEDDDASADPVSFILNAKKLVLKDGFVATYAANAADVSKSEIGQNALITARLVAEAKALLFQKKVLDAIKTSVEAVKSERTRFETDTVPSLTV